MNIKEFDFILPAQLIAQTQAQKRDASRLLVYQDNKIIINLCFMTSIEFLESKINDLNQIKDELLKM